MPPKAEKEEKSMKRFPGWLRVKASSIPSTMLPQPPTSSDTHITTDSIPTTSTREPSSTHPPNSVPATAIFNSLARNPRPWILTRRLWSENSSDLQGELKGVATFTPKPTLHSVNHNHNRNDAGEEEPNKHITEMVYKEEGETAAPGLRGVAGMTWTKKYIWRLADDGHTGDSIEVWFVKIPDGKAISSSTATTTGKGNEAEDESDYVFHNLRFGNTADGANNALSLDGTTTFGETVIPQENFSSDGDFATLTAHGHHLCVNDTYQTTYSFRLQGEDSSFEVVRWASKHVVTGPKKNQVITNTYHRE